MKIIFIHPPLYPVNIDFFNCLGEYVDLTIIQLGYRPLYHKYWTYDFNKKNVQNFKYVYFGGETATGKTKYNLQYLKQIKQINPDIVISIAFWFPSFLLGIFKRIYKFKLGILTNAIFFSEKNNSLLKLIFRKLQIQNVDFIIAASNLTVEYLKSLNYKQTNIYLSVQTINLKNWINSIDNIKLNKKQLREKLKLPVNKKILLGVGNYIQRKNWFLVIKSINKIENVLFLLIGQGELEVDYKKYIKTKKLQNKVKIIGRKEGRELKEFYKASDAFIFPTLEDPFGFVVLEALASNLPVICSKNAGASTLIKSGYNGYVIDPEKDITKGINTKINNFKNIRKNARESIKNLTIENRAKEFYEIFNNMKKT